MFSPELVSTIEMRDKFYGKYSDKMKHPNPQVKHDYMTSGQAQKDYALMIYFGGFADTLAQNDVDFINSFKRSIDKAFSTFKITG